jgi:hypothetical protein
MAEDGDVERVGRGKYGGAGQPSDKEHDKADKIGKTGKRPGNGSYPARSPIRSSATSAPVQEADNSVESGNPIDLTHLRIPIRFGLQRLVRTALNFTPQNNIGKKRTERSVSRRQP